MFYCFFGIGGVLVDLFFMFGDLFGWDILKWFYYDWNRCFKLGRIGFVFGLFISI